MGGDTEVSANYQNTFSTNVLQVSNQKCDIACVSTFNNNTVIIIGGSGGVSISSTCTITDASCQLKATLDSSIENVIDNILKQTSQAMSGFDLTWHHVEQSTDMTNVVQNSVSQIMNSTCAITATSNMNNNFIYIQNRDGPISLSSSASVSASTCSMDNYAKASATTSATNQAEQDSKTFNIFSIMFIGFIIMIVMVGVCMMAFILTGGLNKAIDTAAQTAANNPQLFL